MPTKPTKPTKPPAPATKRPQAKQRNRGTGGKGIPGRDYSGVDPDTGIYKVVRGTHKGEYDRKKKAGVKGGKSQKPGELNPDAPKTPQDRKRLDMEICGANRTGRTASGPGICCNPAGWGTGHVGYGKCRHHGGLFESHKKSAQKKEAQEIVEKMYGGPKEIDPQTALLEEVQRTAGHVQWLGNLIKDFQDTGELKQRTETGVMPSVWIEMYQKEREHLVTVSAKAINAGVQQLQIQIAQQQGEMLAAALRQIFADPRLALSNVQKAALPKVVRDHLSQLPVSGGGTLLLAEPVPIEAPLPTESEDPTIEEAELIT